MSGSDTRRDASRPRETGDGATSEDDVRCGRAGRHDHAALCGRTLRPLWFLKRERPTAYAKLYRVLEELEVVEELAERAGELTIGRALTSDER
jgi:hypothetical protein